MKVLIAISFAWILFHSTASNATFSCHSLFEKVQTFFEKTQNLAHDSIGTDLYNGEIVEMHPFSENGNGQATFKAKIYNSKTGRTRDVIVKPREPGDRGGYARSPMEYVAYDLNRKLQMDYVPPVSYKNFGVPGFTEGAVIHFAPESKILLDVPKSDWGLRDDIVKSDYRILNVLLQNPDGHYKNLIWGNHWVDGKKRPIFIDFGASMKGGSDIRIDHYWAYRTSHFDYEVKVISRRTYESLKKLKYDDLKHLAPHFINNGELHFILQIAYGIVSYFDHLQAQNPNQAVIIDYDYN